MRFTVFLLILLAGCGPAASETLQVPDQAVEVSVSLYVERSSDLAMFYRSDSNTNETGLFPLEIAVDG